jgi:hypothetical protein
VVAALAVARSALGVVGRVAVAEVEPEGAVVAQRPAYAGEDLDEALDVFARRRLEA